MSKEQISMTIGINLKRLHISEAHAKRIQGDYKTMNEAAVSAVKNWWRVRKAEIITLREILDEEDIDEMKDLTLPDDISKNVLIAIAEDNSMPELSQKIKDMTTSTFTVLLDLISKKQLENLEVE